MQADPTEKIVAFAREKCIDKLVDGYCRNFNELPIERFREPRMRAMAELWKRSSPNDHAALRHLIRLGAQNSIATLLGALDEDHYSPEFPYSLSALDEGGETRSVARDLLAEFWRQEELAAQVNV